MWAKPKRINLPNKWTVSKEKVWKCIGRKILEVKVKKFYLISVTKELQLNVSFVITNNCGRSSKK